MSPAAADATAVSAHHEAATLRADIEGLRAVAVLLVIGYHFFPEALPGGYVGVDVFFVLSGYLITRSLLHARSGGPRVRDWLLDFWARRVRRLLPNALLVLAASAVAGLMLMSQFSLKRLGSDIAWSAVFSANWLFVLRSIDYLAWDETQRSALLHFWSLAVEEQFYLVWPFALLALLRARTPRSRAVLCLVLAGASFVMCVLLSQRNLTHAFFSTPARAWEPLVGAALALRPWPIAAAWRPVLGLAGIAAVGAAAMMFGDETRHPGWPTLWPVIGTAAVIVAGERATVASRWLGNPFLCAIGARSYSIYLWHWPVLVLGASAAAVLEPMRSVALLALALVLAEVAYRAVEQPARFVWARRWPSSRWIAVALLAAGAAAGLGLLLRAHGAADVREAFGMRPQPRSATPLPPLAKVRDDLPVVYRNGCHLGLDAEASPDCTSGAADAAASVVLFGDSHAAQWFSAIDQAATARGLALHSWTKSSCPSVDVTVWNAIARSTYRACDAWREHTLRRIEGLKPSLVVLSNLVESVPALTRRDGAGPLRAREAAEAWSAGLDRVVERLQRAGIAVVVIRDIPRPRPDVLDCLYAAADPAHCELAVSEATATPALDVTVAQRRGVPLWDFTAELCPRQRCTVVRPDTHWPVYRDHNHLTDTEVRRLAGALDARWAAGTALPRGPLR